MKGFFVRSVFLPVLTLTFEPSFRIDILFITTCSVMGLNYSILILSAPKLEVGANSGAGGS